MAEQTGASPHDQPSAPVDPSIVPTPKVEGPWTVTKALEAAGLTSTPSSPPSVIQYFHLLERLKTTKRAGWRRFGIGHGESIADHMYRMSMLALAAPAPLSAKLDRDRCVKLCLVHDVAESVVGDLTPLDRVPKAEKQRREADTVAHLTALLPAGQGAELGALWREFEDGETLEARFAQDLDKLELLLQMVEYERRGGGAVDLSEFTYVATKITLPESKEWADAILEERRRLWEGRRRAGEGPGALNEELKKLQDDYYQKS